MRTIERVPGSSGRCACKTRTPHAGKDRPALPGSRTILAGPSNAQNITTMRPFSARAPPSRRRCPSNPDKQPSCRQNSERINPFGEQFTMPSVASGAVATKTRFCRPSTPPARCRSHHTFCPCHFSIDSPADRGRRTVPFVVVRTESASPHRYRKRGLRQCQNGGDCPVMGSLPRHERLSSAIRPIR